MLRRLDEIQAAMAKMPTLIEQYKVLQNSRPPS
jgi:hypothetical protein